ncbi:MAG TPA: S41 family peptidase, partial [Ignavibacteriaceae bacterium]|nr:S41 family peptidase [Ignavibacteriaceae bacterium]
MKKFLLIFLLLVWSNNLILFSQEEKVNKYNPERPIYFIPKNHDANFKAIPEKSLYKSKSDWQYIIDTTWGAGEPISQKLLIFNTFAHKIQTEFDGFLSLSLNWDSLKNYYLDKINDSTSRGAFSSIISHLAYDLKDKHTGAWDNIVVNTPLNPGIPVLLLGSYNTVEHFGAVTTVLPDSTTLVLRVVPDHPLNIEPGDIILGYEGVPWKIIFKELLGAGLPMVAKTGGCASADTYLNLFGAGINWHLFDTIDILKYATGDTVHLSVLPLLNLNIPPMVNNEQLPIPNIPFPDVLSDQCATYGILEGTNIGYIYLAQEYPTATADAQFYQAVDSLKNTDAIIIDMRLNFGGWAFFNQAFNILFNDTYSTIEDAYRCNAITFDLCPAGNWSTFKVTGLPTLYDRPIAVLLGPTCVSMGDLTANRLMYHPMVRFFGKSANSSLGDNRAIESFGDWTINYSIGDMFHTHSPGVYLNRREFPIDYPVWHNPDDVAQGKDAVVEKALEWIDNLVYPKDIKADKIYYPVGEDTVKISTIIENPNSHQLAARAYLSTLEGILIDSVNFVKQTLKTSGEQWTTGYLLPPAEDIYKVSVTVFDETAQDQFIVPNATRFTTAGPVVLDSITYTKQSIYYRIKTFLKNLSNTVTIPNAAVRLKCDDPWLQGISPTTHLSLDSIAPGATVSNQIVFMVRAIDSLFPGYFNFKVEVLSDGWHYWTDSMQVTVTGIDGEEKLPTEYALLQNFPNPFNPSTKISWQSPVGNHQTIKVFDVLGNEIATLVNEYKAAGRYEVEFNASRLASG